MTTDQPDTHAAERARLLAMLANGPERRIAQDRARGLNPQRCDMTQALHYRTLLTTLDRCAHDLATPSGA